MNVPRMFLRSVTYSNGIILIDNPGNMGMEKWALTGTDDTTEKL